MTNAYLDLSVRTGDLFPNTKQVDIPMYSYSRPASMLWNAIANELVAKGWTEDRIIVWLKSKNTRWALDGDLGDAIDKIGKEYAKTLDV